MGIHRNRLRSFAFSLVAASACATAGFAGPLTAALVDPKDAPAYVSACSVESDASGTFTPSITVTDRKPSAVTTADVAIDFFDAQNRLLGESVISPPYGPEGVPFGALDHVACHVKRAEFVDGSIYVAKTSSGNSFAAVAGAVLGVGAAAALIGSSHSSKSSGSSPASAAPTSGASATPVPVESIVPLQRRKK